MDRRQLFCAFSLLLILGCSSGSSDVNSTTLTISKLDTIEMVIIAMHADGIDCAKLHTISDFIKKADRVEMISKKDVATHRLETDAWGNTFNWQLQSDLDAIIISVISNGQDGIPQNGNGDDISLIVTIPRHGRPNTKINKPKTFFGH